MSFQLHPNCKERLSVVIAEVLSGIIVQHHVLPTSLEMRDFGQCEKVMPQAQREALESYIGDTPLTTFVDSWLIRKLRNTLDYSAEPQPSMLTDLPGFEDSHAVAKCLVDDLSTLPWQYVFTIPLPGEIGRIWAKAKNPFKIAEHIIIRTPDDTFGEDFPFSGWGNSSPYLRVLALLSPGWDRDAAHLQIYLEGFIAEYGTSATLEDAFDTLKEIFGMGTALQLFRKRFSESAQKKISSFQIHRKVDDSWQAEGSREMDTAASQLFLQMNFKHDQLDENGQIDWSSRVLARLGTVYSDKNARRILVAAQWLFDSDSGSNELLSYVHAAVAMETLLGDKLAAEKVGVVELIKNRCAYLIADTPEEREMLLRDIPKIYDVRSRIVHDGKKRLSGNERRFLILLQWICFKVIHREVSVVAKDRSGAPSEE